MGTINYGTSEYITMGIRPAEAAEILADEDFRDWFEENYHTRIEDAESEAYEAAADLAHEYDRDDYYNTKRALEDFENLTYYHITAEPGYYAGFYISIEDNYGIAFDSWEDRREAQKEVTRIKQLLLDLCDCGLCSVWPGWCTTYRDRAETLEDIAEAVKEMREDIRNKPTWRQYEQRGAFARSLPVTAYL